MGRNAILFIDGKADATTTAICAAVAKVHGNNALKVINFHSSQLADLTLISAHRVVTLPTFVVEDDGDVVVRMISMPSPSLAVSLMEKI